MKMELKHDMDDGPYIEVTEIYTGFAIKTDAGSFGICQRDAGIEIHLDDGPWFSWQEKEGPVRLGPPIYAKVPIKSLRHMATFACEHGEHDACKAHPPRGYSLRGGRCNSCWTRGFAEAMLGANGVPIKEPPPPPNKEPEFEPEFEPEYGDPGLDPDKLGSLGRSRDG